MNTFTGFWVGSQGVGSFDNMDIIRFAKPYQRKDGIWIWKPTGESGMRCWSKSVSGWQKMEKEIDRLKEKGFIQIDKPYQTFTFK